MEGLKFDRGFISPYFITDAKNQKCIMEDTFVLMVDKKVSTVQSILPFLEFAGKQGKPLLILAEDVESEALTTLIINRLKGVLKVCAVKAPAFGDNRKSQMEDIAILVGGKVINEEAGITLDKADESYLGHAKRIEITKDDTLITEGGGEKTQLDERCEQIKDTISQTTSD